MGKTLIEQYKFIQGESQEFSPEDKAYTKNKGKYVQSMVNFEPAEEEGNIELSKGFEITLDTNIRLPFQNLCFSRDDNGNVKFSGVIGGNLIDITNWRETNTAYETKHSNLKTTGFVDLIPVSKKTTEVAESYMVVLDEGYCKKYDYSTVTALSEGSHNASFGVFVNDRLFTNDMDEPALFRFSGALNPEDFTTPENAGFLLLGDNSNPITAATSIFIPAENTTSIIVTKKDKTYAINGTTQFAQYIFSETIGATSPRGLYALGQDVVFCNKSNIWQLTALSYNGTLRPKNISNAIQEKYKKLINKEYIENSFVFHDTNGYKMYFFLPSTFKYPSIAYGLTSKLGFFRRDYFENQFTCSAKDPETGDIYLGDIYGRIFKFNSGYTYNGNAYDAYIEYGKSDFGTVKLKSGVTQAGDKRTQVEAKITGDVDVILEKQMYSRHGFLQNLQSETMNFKRRNKSVYNRSLYDQSTYDEYDIINLGFELGTFDTLNLTLKVEANGTPITIKELTMLAEEGII